LQDFASILRELLFRKAHLPYGSMDDAVLIHLEIDLTCLNVLDGLMPNPKSGTVTMEVGKAVQDVKAGKIDFKVDKYGIIHASVGKVSFSKEKLAENAGEVLQTLVRLRPSAAKGTYIKSVFISSTMSPGVRIESKSLNS
jgi:ribosomal protein L1